jgi:PAS domain-containing protein
VSRPRPKNLILIITRELASNLATPVFIVDDRGIVIFYNEPAEAILGRTYAESGEMPAEEWRALFAPEGPDGRSLPLDKLPSAIAFRERRPAHGTFTIAGLDGVRREIAATGLPLFARGREFVGVVSIFWQQG